MPIRLVKLTMLMNQSDSLKVLNGKCVIVYKGKMGCVQLMPMFTCKDDVSCRVLFVQRKKKKRSLQQNAVGPVRQKTDWHQEMSPN